MPPERFFLLKDWRNKYQILFIILISFWGLTFPTYCLVYSLDQVDVFRSSHWENPVQEDLLTNVEKKLTGSEWNFCAIIFPQGKEFLKLLPDLSLNRLSVEKIAVLRC